MCLFVSLAKAANTCTDKHFVQDAISYCQYVADDKHTIVITIQSNTCSFVLKHLTSYNYTQLITNY